MIYEGAWVAAEAVTPPNSPSSLIASEIICSGTGADVELTFNDNSEDEEEWVVYKNGSFFDIVTSGTKTSTGEITITANGPLPANETATFTVTAQNGAGESSESNGSTFTSSDSPTTPSVIAAWSGTQPACGVELSWGSDSDACGFRVYRKLCSDSSYTEIADVSGSSYFDTAVSENTCYDYEVEAYNDRGSPRSATESITTGTCEGGPT